MLLIYWDIDKDVTYYYLSYFDSSKIVGEFNIFGELLVGLYLLDYLEYKLVSYRSSWFAELDYLYRYHKKNRKE